jgi:two-component system nitrogen regulation response regulator GlnG
MKPVWVVDDDRSIRWVLEKALARENIPCKLFGSAQEVLNELDNDTPQVLVSDIRMPGSGGIELLRKVKGRHPALPVIIMTWKARSRHFRGALSSTCPSRSMSTRRSN